MPKNPTKIAVMQVTRRGVPDVLRYVEAELREGRPA